MTKERFLQLVKESFAALEDNTGHLPAEDVDIPILEEPLVGFASSDDPLFEVYRDPKAIGPDWRAPREWMPEAETAVAFFFPFTEEVRSRHREAVEDTDEAWNTCYGKNVPLVNAFLDDLCGKLEAEGIKTYQPHRDPSGTRTPIPVMAGDEEDVHFSTSWSTRHICYAAGLGTFGIHRHIITEKGCCGTLGTFIMDLKLDPTPRAYTEVYEYCTHCGACTGRCPAKAITLEYYRNLKKCSAFSGSIRERFGSGFCGKCLVGIPCERQIPGRD